MPWRINPAAPKDNPSERQLGAVLRWLCLWLLGCRWWCLHLRRCLLWLLHRRCVFRCTNKLDCVRRHLQSCLYLPLLCSPGVGFKFSIHHHFCPFGEVLLQLRAEVNDLNPIRHSLSVLVLSGASRGNSEFECLRLTERNEFGIRSKIPDD